MEQDTLLPESTGNTQESVAPSTKDKDKESLFNVLFETDNLSSVELLLRHKHMTEKLLTGLLSLNTNKQIILL